jgi:mannose/cellobiose epimerase-like protein (N-acyl-D-glucosamine 2-epimerase family)
VLSKRFSTNGGSVIGTSTGRVTDRDGTRTRVPSLDPERTGVSRFLPAPHADWLGQEAVRLLKFGRASLLAGAGFGWLDSQGAPTPGQPQHLYVAGRMTHAYAVGVLLGVPGCGAVADHGVHALAQVFRDDQYGGWYNSLDPGSMPLDTTKTSYSHSFVLLAGASAAIAGRSGARELLEAALISINLHFWDVESGTVVEQWDRRFTDLLDYRGLNSNMHMLEAYLAAYSATGQRYLLDRCVRISQRAVEVARLHRWRLPEHFNADWEPLLAFNDDRRADPFKPYGSTTGHWFEWSRLLLLTEAAFAPEKPSAPPWLREAAVALFDLGTREAWSADGAEGFVYTVDWEGRPVVRSRLHWVVAEAIGAAATLHAVTGEERYLHWYRTWWDYARRYFVDPVHGSWRHELDPHNQPASLIKKGKADIYHALQATVIPRVPVRPSVAQGCVDMTIASASQGKSDE